MSSEFRSHLLQEMESLRTVDCHSHTMLRREYEQNTTRDLFTMMAYFEREIHSATGKSSAQLYEGATSDAERWKRLKAVLNRTRNESYWRHNLVVYQRLFDLADPELTDANWAALNECIKQRTAQPGWYDYVTREVCGLETQVRNVPWFEDWEPEYFTCTLRMEEALELTNHANRERLAQYLNRSITDLHRLKSALAELMEQYRARGSVGIKLAHAYRRTLQSDLVPEADAARYFAKAVAGEPLTWPERKAVEDHIIFFLGELCAELGQVFQIHTGVQGNWGFIPDSNPLHLLPLIHTFKQVKFDLFHAGYPFSREIGMLGKHYPNVWLNMAWMYVITMEGSRQSLSEWIDLVPGDRLLGFGSDVGWPEFVYGHLVMARSCLADVLTKKVKRDFLSEEAAISLVDQLLRDNAIALYGLTTE
ncbi:MAG: amidohydrolase family protein [Candidatus Zipacnadales bacterium]